MYEVDWYTYTCMKDVWVGYGYWIKIISKLFVITELYVDIIFNYNNYAKSNI